MTRTQCAADETPGPTERCYTVDATNRSWTSARFFCQQRGSGWELAALESELEGRFAVTLATSAQVWIGGLDDQAAPEQFVWSVDGTPFWNGTFTGSPGGLWQPL